MARAVRRQRALLGAPEGRAAKRRRKVQLDCRRRHAAAEDARLAPAGWTLAFAATAEPRPARASDAFADRDQQRSRWSQFGNRLHAAHALHLCRKSRPRFRHALRPLCASPGTGRRAATHFAQACEPCERTRAASIHSAVPMNTVYQQFASTAAKYGADEFLYIDAVTAATYGMSTQSISWGEAAQRVEALVSKYKAAGYGHGHRVGLLLENRPEFILHWMALNALGASVVPMSAEMRSAELTYLIGHSEIVLAVSIPSRVEALEEAVSLANSSACRVRVRQRRRHSEVQIECAGSWRTRTANRVCIAVHIGHHWTTQRLPPHQLVLPSRRPFLRESRWSRYLRSRQRPRAYPSAAQSRERDGLLDDGGHYRGRMPHSARSLSSEVVVEKRAGQAARPSFITWA